jgi:hypothetical protein
VNPNGVLNSESKEQQHLSWLQYLSGLSNEVKAQIGGNHYCVPHSDYDFEDPPTRLCHGLRDLIQIVEDAYSDGSSKLTVIPQMYWEKA